MDEFKASKIIEFYESLESEFLSFLKVVPYEEQNKTTWSPKLIEILIGCGSILDSLFRATMPESYNNKSRAEFDIKDFCGVFSEKLEPLKSLVYIAPPKFLMPYEAWSTAKAPSWWSNYNKVKHDRLAYMHLATSETTLNALCGLFEAIAHNPKMGKAIMRYQWADFGSWNPDFRVPQLDTKPLCEVLQEHETLLVESKLFITTVGANFFPDEISKIKPAFYTGTDRKLIAFLGKWMYDSEDIGL